MIKVYPAIFHLEDGSYWVNFPDLDGCYSDGETLEAALENAQEALALHLSALLDADQELPASTELANIEVTDGVSSYVSADPNKFRRRNKAVKKTLTIPEWLNEEALARNINFSKVLQEGLLHEIGTK